MRNHGSPCKSITNAVNHASSGYNINIAADVYSTANTTETLPLDLSFDLTFSGAGAATTSIDGVGLDQTIAITSGALALNISGITLKNALAASSGGAIEMTADFTTVTLDNVALTGNKAFSAGGGIWEDCDCTLIIKNSTFSNNYTDGSGGAIEHLFGVLTISNTTFINNRVNSHSGGAIDSSNGTLNISGSTFYSNSAPSGGAVWTGIPTTITNSSFYSNVAAGGSAIDVADHTAIRAGGSNGAVYNGGGFITFYNTIVANNVAGGNCHGAMIDGGSNLQWNPNSGCGFALTAGDPMLGPFGNYGGATNTLPLFFGSAAIDFGNDTICAAAPVNNLDQRGVSRPQGSHCDIGAFEGFLYPLYLPLIVK